jgi:hypothetical protein
LFSLLPVHEHTTHNGSSKRWGDGATVMDGRPDPRNYLWDGARSALLSTRQLRKWRSRSLESPQLDQLRLRNTATHQMQRRATRLDRETVLGAWLSAIAVRNANFQSQHEHRARTTSVDTKSKGHFLYFPGSRSTHRSQQDLSSMCLSLTTSFSTRRRKENSRAQRHWIEGMWGPTFGCRSQRSTRIATGGLLALSDLHCPSERRGGNATSSSRSFGSFRDF